MKWGGRKYLITTNEYRIQTILRLADEQTQAVPRLLVRTAILKARLRFGVTGGAGVGRQGD